MTLLPWRKTSGNATRDHENLRTDQHVCAEEFISRSELETIQKDFETSITQNSTEIRMDFTAITDEIKENVSTNQLLLEEYIRFKGALIELGKVGNAFTAELSNEELAFKENGQKIAYISNQSLRLPMRRSATSYPSAMKAGGGLIYTENQWEPLDQMERSRLRC